MIRIKSPDPVLTYAAYFYAEQLGVLELEGFVSIIFGVNDTLDGTCIDLGDVIQIGICKDLSDPIDIFQVLAHETVHCAQILRGDLEDGPRDVTYWKGEKYHDAEPGSESYYELPWEKEAFELQTPLMTALFHDKNFLKKLLTMGARKAN